jgi:hypothetical protein
MIEEKKIQSYSVVDCWDLEWFQILAPKTKCKHRDGSCQICGTSNQKDEIHTTKNGKGLIARIRK